MIEIYSEFNSNFEQNGNMPLFPISCQIEVNLNSDWILTLEHPIDDLGRYKYIQSGAVLKVPSFNGKQLFRVYAVERTNDSVVAEAQPIFMDSMNEVFIVDKRPTEKNGQEALNYLLEGTKYSAESDILNLNTAYYINKNLIEVINGDDENSFINRWGGEIVFDNFKIIINNHAGRDKGVMIKYGRNLSGISEQVNRSDLITRIVPKGFDGIMLSGSSPWVDSPKIRSYPIIYTKVVEFSDVKVKESEDDEEGFDTLAEAQEELKRLSKLEFSENHVDEESVQLEIDLILLQNTVEYKEYKVLEDISLGDTVRCIHSKLDIDTRLKCIGLMWDCLIQRVTSVTLGNPQPTYFDNNTETTNRFDQIIRPDGSVIADKVQGTLDAFSTQLKAQNSVAKKQNVRAILFEDLDDKSPTYGALSIGTQGLQVAKKKTLDGLSWNWRTAITANGIVADLVNVGILQGIEILAEKGSIGGWKISDHGMFKEYFETNPETNETYKRIIEFRSGLQSDNIFLAYDEGAGEPYFRISNSGFLENESVVTKTAFIGTTFNYDAGDTGEDVVDPSNLSLYQPFMIRCLAKEEGWREGAIFFTANKKSQENGVATLAPNRTAIVSLGSYTRPYKNIWCNKLNIQNVTGDARCATFDGNILKILSSTGEMRVLEINGSTKRFDMFSSDELSLRIDEYTGSYDFAIWNNSTDVKTVYIQGHSGKASFSGNLACKSLQQTSDLKDKENIELITTSSALEFVKNLNPVIYNFKNDNEKRAGFIAQEVVKNSIENFNSVDFATATLRNDDKFEKVEKSKALDNDDDVKWGMDYTELIAPIVAVVKYQETKINELNEKIKKIEEQLNDKS